MDHVAEQFEIDGITVKLHWDQSPENPRGNGDFPAVMVCWHSRYQLGDKKALWAEPWNDPQEFFAWAKKSRAVVLPLYLYDHSGLSMSTGSFSCPWDSGQVGFIYWDTVQADKCCGKSWRQWTRARREKDMRAQVEEYDMYLRGEVYGYTLHDSDENELEDSGWGFYGLEYAKQEATSAARYAGAQLAKERKATAELLRNNRRILRNCWAD